jgi:GDP-4-dehydro-6-deoxy-D-mannose reductase
VHLAGLAAVGPSYTRSQEYIEVNSRIMTRMSEALLLDGERPRIVVVSSGAVYMAPPGHVSLSEAHAVQPTSPYAVAKLLVEHQASYYAARGLDTVIARPFNHIGPGQSSGFLLPDLATELLALAPGKALATGNIDTARDYTDVRDVARAYLTLAAAPTHAHHIYNVASGTPRSGREMLNALAESLQRDVPQTVTDPARLRPNDAPRIAGDSTRIREEFGWRPNIPWQQSVHDYVAGMPPYLPV